MSEQEETVEVQRSKRALDHAAELWLEMSGTEGWKLLSRELANQETKLRKLRLDSMMDGFPINQREIDYDRGLVDGLKRPALILETARRRLENRDKKNIQPEVEEAKNW